MFVRVIISVLACLDLLLTKLTSFAADVDHRGIPNTQLNIEEPELAERFRGESTAEQNSVAISWDLLMEPKFKQLRRAIYGSETERERFLQLIVNCVMATDIVNPELKVSAAIPNPTTSGYGDS